MTNKNNDSIDFVAIIKKYIKNWKLFLATITFCGVAGLFYIWITPPTYRVIANVLVKQKNSDSSGGNMQNILMRSFGSGFGGENVDDEIYVIASHTNLRNTIKKLGLNRTHQIQKNLIKKIDAYNNYPVDVYVSENILDTLSVPAVFKINVSQEGEITVKTRIAKYKAKNRADKFPVAIETPYGLFTLTTTKDYEPGEKLKTTIAVAGYDMVAEEWASMLESFIPNKRTNIISLSIEDINIQRGKDFLNTLVALYNQQGLENKNIEAAKTGAFIDDRLTIISKELYDIETEIEKYKVDNRILDVVEDAKAAYVKREQYAEIQLQAELRNHIVAIVEDFINNPENKNSLLISTSGVVGDAISKYNDLLILRRELLRSAKEDNPVIKKLDAQIDLAWQNIKDVLMASKEEKEVSLKDIRQLEDEMQEKVSEAPAREREYLNMKRQQAIKSELFMFLLQRREDNLITLAANTPRGQIVDSAYNLNKPVSMSKKMTLLIWLVFGFALAAGYIYLKDVFRTKFSTREELEKLTALPLLGEVSVNDTGHNIVVSSGVNTSISELFRLIRSNLQFLLGNGEKVMLVTSSVSGEGKSFISCNMAASLALTGKKVVVVGLDIRQPKLGEYLNIDGRVGVTNYLASTNVSLSDIIHKEPFAAGLDVILAGPVPPNPAELLLSERLENLFKELKKTYDYIIIDSAPVGMVSDTFSIDRVSDISIYVCRADYTEKDNIRYAEKLSQDKKLKKLYLVLNATNAKKGYGYGYGESKK